MVVSLRMNERLNRPGYRVVATRPGLEPAVAEVAEALEFGAAVRPDPGREDFYSLWTGSGCYYIHVYETGRKVYVLSPLGMECREPEAMEFAHAGSI